MVLWCIMVALETSTAKGKSLEHVHDKEREGRILKQYTPEEQKTIRLRQEILSSLAYFIGKDFEIPVELNGPGQGWHWDFEHNIIRVDPNDLLEKSMDFLRFVISHEGGHRRISRANFIPQEQWQEPGFAFMMNAIEDPRTNNFVGENYPKFKEQMAVAYEHDLDIEDKSIDKAKRKLGYQPRFMKAGFEYIRQWFREVQNQDIQISDDLPPEVRDVVEQTLDAAQDSWWRYPSRQEADSSEHLIREYAKASYKVNRDQVWPLFKTLVDEDMRDQQMQEFMKGMQSGGQTIPQDIQDKLTSEMQQELEKAIRDAIEQGALVESETEDGAEGMPVDMDSLSEDLKQKLREYIDALPEEKKKELQEKAQRTLTDFGAEVSEALQGKLNDSPESLHEAQEAASSQSQPPAQPDSDWSARERIFEDRGEELRKAIEAALSTEQEKDAYQEALKDTAHLIDQLASDLRDIFVKRKLTKTEAGYRYGRRWNVRQRIREKVAGLPLIKTQAREQPESPSEESDYAITLMIDLSGSMGHGGKIQEAFKSAVVLAETLHDLGIRFEIVGFQDILLEFKSFDDDFNDEMRMKLNQLLLEVQNQNPGGHNNMGDNNDGECLLAASRNLANQYADNKFLIVLSDGEPAMDSGKKSQSQLDRELKDAVKEITENTDQQLIGIGLLSDAVRRYYKNNLPDVTTKEMVETLGEVLRGIIENT